MRNGNSEQPGISRYRVEILVALIAGALSLILLSTYFIRNNQLPSGIFGSEDQQSIKHRHTRKTLYVSSTYRGGLESHAMTTRTLLAKHAGWPFDDDTAVTLGSPINSLPQAARREYLRLEYAELRHIMLDGADVRGINLQYADMGHASMDAIDARFAILNRVNLFDASLANARFGNAQLRRANLVRTFLVEADFSGADLRDATLSYSNLKSTNLTNADCRAAKLGHVEFDANTKLQGTDLRGALEMPDDFVVFARASGARLDDAPPRVTD